MEPILPEGIGYFVLIGIGLVMALLVSGLVKAETKWLGTRRTFEWFSTAGRNVKTGLIASSVVSAWTWAATLLQSSTVAYEYGIGGPFWYAAGASIQVVLFAILAIEIKRKAPNSHTFPEIINIRLGKHAHKIFLMFALLTNTIVTAMLILGGAAVLNSLTGVNIYLAVFLIPVGIVIYTFFGGLKATFLADYTNTIFLFLVVLVFVAAIYFTSQPIGGIEGMYHKLVNVAAIKPIQGNSQGSYLTMASNGALLFGIINIVGNFGAVFVNQAYWQRAIAARPRSIVPGFLIGGLGWFAIPFTLATTLGLSAVALGITLSPAEIGSGLVAPTVAVHLLGELGAILVLAVIFTAVTSAGSAELVAVSSLLTYDIYRTHVKPAATGRELMRFSRLVILIFGVGMGLIASVLFNWGINLEYLYLAMGILIGSAVAPIAFSILWRKTNRMAAIIAAIGGLVLGIFVWLFTADFLYNSIDTTSTGQIIPLLFGNVTSIISGAVITIVGSIIKSDNFNFDNMKQRIRLVDDRMRSIQELDSDEKFLNNAARFSRRYLVLLVLVLVVIWPIPLYLSGYVFSLEAYYIWIGIAIVWAGAAACTVIILPIIEAKSAIMKIFGGIFGKFFSIDSSVISDNRSYNELIGNSYENEENIRKILVSIDGSEYSIRALNFAMQLYDRNSSTKIYALNVIEWVDGGEEESFDDEMAVRMREEGSLMLKSLITYKRASEIIRIVKLGNPSSKIVEVAEKLGVDMIVIGKKGLGDSDSDFGRVSSKVLKGTSKPVVVIK
ncbi:MAG: sodium:solute symporter family transporter [Nitrosotalea sp.]